MVDKPETRGEGDGPEVKQSSAPPIAGAAQSDIPQTHSQGQEEHASKTRQYTTYVAWPFVAIWRLFRWLFLWADDHDGGITALATVAIVVLTMFYVRYSRKQWIVMDGQLKEMKKASSQQQRIARVEFGEAIVNQSQLFVYRVDGRMRAEVKFQNTGKIDAMFIKVAAQMAFRDSDPGPSEYAIGFKDSFPNRLSPFDEKNGNRAVSTIEDQPIPSEYKTHRLYVWGKFSYEDSMGPKDSEMFCLWGPEQNWPDIFKNPLGYAGRWADCKTPASK